MVKVEDLEDTDHSSNDGFLHKTVGSSSSKPAKLVKVEEHDDNGSLTGPFLYENVGSSSSRPSSGPSVIKEESPSNSSFDELRSSFVGMGFSSALVDKVIEENGSGDVNLLLEALIKDSNSSPQDSDSWDDFSSLEKQEVNSPIEHISDPKQETEELGGPSSYAVSEKRYYLSTMDFSDKEIDLAMRRLGINASLPELVDFIVTAQTAGSSSEKMNGFADHDNVQLEESTTATLFGTMDKTLCLLQMGFTETEVSSAIDTFGPDVPLSELADSIFAKRMPFNVDKEEDLWGDDATGSNGQNQNVIYSDHTKQELPKRCRPTTDAWITKAPSSDGGWITKASTSNVIPFDHDDVKTVKKAKPMTKGDNTASCSNRQDDWEPIFDTKPNEYGWVKEETPFIRTPNIRSNANGQSNLPYFLYGNVVDISQGSWKKLSQFLYGTEPEFVNSQFFSALIRKEGYLHNLPTEKRFHIVPKPPMTIEDAFPQTKKWWPSWDTRKQLSCLSSETTGVLQLCDRLGKIMMESQGFLSKEQQTDIIHQCKQLNLIWVGLHRLRPMEPDQVETILGYPKEHTEISTLQPADRLDALRYCFQTDTIGYHLSVLRSMFPDGIRVLSVFTGVGGAEVALHKLGIWLKCVVSVEASEIKQKILKRWWQNTGQSGVLRQVGGIEKLTFQTLTCLMKQFGGFDIIIGSNPGDYTRAGNRDSSVDMDFNLFFEFVRVFQRVRSLMGRNS